MYRLSDDHEGLREAVRAVVEAKVAPYAAEVDDKSAFPQQAYDALRAADFHAPHIPEQYDGVGADALATCLVIEEVARGCASSSLIPAVNKLGTMPLLLAASEEVKAKYLPPVASGEAMFSYGLSEREAGSDTASMRCKATEDGDEFVLNGQKSWITNAGISEYYTVLAVTDPDAAARPRASPPSWWRSPTRASPSASRSASSASRAARPASCTSTAAGSRPTGWSVGAARG